MTSSTSSTIGYIHLSDLFKLKSTHNPFGGLQARFEEEGEGEDTSRSGRGSAPAP